jgi:hypothetical protein
MTSTAPQAINADLSRLNHLCHEPMAVDNATVNSYPTKLLRAHCSSSFLIDSGLAACLVPALALAFCHASLPGGTVDVNTTVTKANATWRLF